jgi:predicted HTH domain antitoxin
MVGALGADIQGLIELCGTHLLLNGGAGIIVKGHPMDVQLQIPDDVARIIQIEQPDLSRAALEALALEGYRSERLSEAQVRRMLGFRTRMQVHAFLKAHNVHLNYSTDELEKDLESLKGFEEKLSA